MNVQARAAKAVAGKKTVGAKALYRFESSRRHHLDLAHRYGKR
jgi:hypothetical protein